MDFEDFLIEYVWDLNDVEDNRSCDLPVNSENGGPSFSTGNCFSFLNIQNSGTQNNLMVKVLQNKY